MDVEAAPAVAAAQADVIRIPIRGLDEFVVIPVSELPDDAGDLLELFKAEYAPLDIWHRFVVRIARRRHGTARQRCVRMTYVGTNARSASARARWSTTVRASSLKPSRFCRRPPRPVRAPRAARATRRTARSALCPSWPLAAVARNYPESFKERINLFVASAFLTLREAEAEAAPERREILLAQATTALRSAADIQYADTTLHVNTWIAEGVLLAAPVRPAPRRAARR